MNWRSWSLAGTGLVSFGMGAMQLNKLYEGHGTTLTVVSVILCGLAAVLLLVAVVQTVRKPPT
jgi:uncharacterized membrane protein YuzA (DUF378 family)